MTNDWRVICIGTDLLKWHTTRKNAKLRGAREDLLPLFILLQTWTVFFTAECWGPFCGLRDTRVLMDLAGSQTDSPIQFLFWGLFCSSIYTLAAAFLDPFSDLFPCGPADLSLKTNKIWYTQHQKGALRLKSLAFNKTLVSGKKLHSP